LAEGHSILQKIWASHQILPASGEDADTLLYIDRCLVHEESGVAFDGLREAGARSRNPSQTIAFSDHYAPTRDQEKVSGTTDPEVRMMLEELERNASQQNIRHFGLNDSARGIMHVVAPELGSVLPGMTVVGSDSHTSTAGAFGAYAFGLGQDAAQEGFHAFLTQL
jgi:3-isopropylmalate/(R)-2-methylmalate dehydratase large subunit